MLCLKQQLKMDAIWHTMHENAKEVICMHVAYILSKIVCIWWLACFIEWNHVNDMNGQQDNVQDTIFYPKKCHTSMATSIHHCGLNLAQEHLVCDPYM